jgi:mono/diheme cytochrome c family protein
VMHRLAVSKQEGINTLTTVQGNEVCPNHGGGIEWNGGAYDPASNLFVIPSTEECGIFKLTSADPPQYIPGQPYEGGPLPKRGIATGVVSAVDVDTGRLRWRKAMPYPADGGVLITSTGLAFTSDVGGNIYAFDAATGEEYWKYDTRSAITAPLSAYSINGTEYLAVVVGQAGNQATPNLPKSEGSRVIAFAIGNAKTIDNGTTGQVALANVAHEKGSDTEGPPDKSTGTAPYTKEQVTQGAAAYAKECAVCHGAQLQGVSAPALTGPGFGRSHLTAEQLRAIVVQQMPLTAPASLKPDEYAQIMAYLLAYDCVQPAGGGQQPFPSEDLPALQQVQLGSATCAQK